MYTPRSVPAAVMSHVLTLKKSERERLRLQSYSISGSKCIICHWGYKAVIVHCVYTVCVVVCAARWVCLCKCISLQLFPQAGRCTEERTVLI